MVYRCSDCGHIFDPESAGCRQECVGEFWGAPAMISYDCCPECGCDDLDELEQPYDDCANNDDCDGDCKNCLIYLRNEGDE